MPRLALVLSLAVLDGCVAPTALRGTGDISDTRGCREEEMSCPEGGGGRGGLGSSLAYAAAATALGVGVGALVYRIARWRPPVDLRPRAPASAAVRSP